MALSTVNREGTSFTLIDDSFNANPDSMKAGLNGLKAWNSNDGKEPFRVALLGACWNSAPMKRHCTPRSARMRTNWASSDHRGRFRPRPTSRCTGTGSGGRCPSEQSASVDCVHDIDAAEQLVIDLARNHPDAVVLLKGSHASGLSALAERWAKN